MTVLITYRNVLNKHFSSLTPHLSLSNPIFWANGEKQQQIVNFRQSEELTLVNTQREFDYQKTEGETRECILWGMHQPQTKKRREPTYWEKEKENQSSWMLFGSEFKQSINW